MASQRIEEIMRQASAKDQAAFKDSVQQLKDNNVQLKADSYGPQTPPRQAEWSSATEPKLNETVFPNQQKPEQRGAQKIEQTRMKTQTDATELRKEREKSNSIQTHDKGR